MSKYIPNWRYWVEPSALVGLSNGIFWLLLGIIGIAPLIKGDLEWSLLIMGVLLTILAWYSAARSGAKTAEAESRKEETLKRLADAESRNAGLLRLAAEAASEAAAAGPRIESQNDEMLRELRELRPWYQRQAIFALSGLAGSTGALVAGAPLSIEGTGETNLQALRSSGLGGVEVSPPPGELTLEGHAPTVTVSPKIVNEEIKRRESVLFNHLRRHHGYGLRDAQGREQVDPDWVPFANPGKLAS